MRRAGVNDGERVKKRRSEDPCATEIGESGAEVVDGSGAAVLGFDGDGNKVMMRHREVSFVYGFVITMSEVCGVEESGTGITSTVTYPHSLIRDSSVGKSAPNGSDAVT